MRKIIILLFVFILFLPSVLFADIIKLKNSNKVIVGKIIDEIGTDLIVKLKGGGTCQFPKSWVKKIEKNYIPESELYTPQDKYFERLKKVSEDDAQGNLELGLWCFKNVSKDEKFYEMAYKHLMRAKELNPDFTEKIDEKLKFIEDRKAKKIYLNAKRALKSASYLIAERQIFNILCSYPNSDYVDKANKLLIQMWGQDKAAKLIGKQDELPPVAIDSRELLGILRFLKTKEFQNSYLEKCLNKAKDFEERTKDFEDKEKKQSYIISALSCYEILLASDNNKIKNLAQVKIEGLSKMLLRSYPLPKDRREKEMIVEYLGKIKDDSFINDICNHYFLKGEGFQNKVSQFDQSKEGKDMLVTAYNCYSIVYYFSKDETEKQDALQKMNECESLLKK